MKSPDYKTIGIKIRQRRKDLGITQGQMADSLGVNPSHVSNIETGRAHPSLMALINIANRLKCSVDLFIDEEYTFDPNDNLGLQILSKLNCTDAKTKEKIIQIINIL